MAEILDILTCTRSLLAPAGAWTQGTSARTAAGGEVTATAPEATCWCLIGALGVCVDRLALLHSQRDAEALLRRVIVLSPDVARVESQIADQPPMYSKSRVWLAGYNDTPGRTQAEVLALLDVAIAEAARA